MFETKESGKRRYLGTIVGISDLDPLSWLDCLVGNFSTSQDVQSQITSVSLADSQAFSRPDFPDNSGATLSSNMDFDESSLLHNSSWQQVTPPPMRTYTKNVKMVVRPEAQPWQLFRVGLVTNYWVEAYLGEA
ncbi:hypothetical protein AAG906_038341 [Vitis piasezkii]